MIYENNEMPAENTENSETPQAYTVNKAHYFVAKNGFGYVLLSKEYSNIEIINITFNPVLETLEDGIITSAKVLIQTPTSLLNLFKENDSDIFVVKYNEWIIAVKSSSEFKTDSQSVAYEGEVLNIKNSNFIITSEEEAERELRSGSIPYWINFSSVLGVPVFPAYLSRFNIKEPYLSVEVTETSLISPVRNDDNKLIQHKKDKVKLHLINADSKLAQEILYKIEQAGIEYEAGFACLASSAWKDDSSMRQSSFGVMTNKKTLEMTINYYTGTDTDIVKDSLKKILMTVKGFEYILFEQGE